MMIDIICFKKVEVDKVPQDEEEARGEEADKDEEKVKANKTVVGPVTIWIGIFPDSTSAAAAYDMAQDILALLRDYQITDVNINYSESFYTCKASPWLLQSINDLDPLLNIISPCTPTLSLCISTKAWPNTQWMIALYFTKGGGSNNLLGLLCHHNLNDS